jgi:hypothetical protein
MNASALLGLLGRRSLALTLGAMAIILIAIFSVDHSFLDPNDPRRVFYFQVVYNAVAIAILISLGGFLGRAIGELDRVRVSRVIPGLRRQITQSLALLIPVIAAVALVGLYVLIPQRFGSVHPVTRWFLNVFLLSLGVGLGWSRLMPVAIVLLVAKISAVMNHLQHDAVLSSAVALIASVALLTLRHQRFLAPAQNKIGRTLSSPLLSLESGQPGSGAQRKPVTRVAPDWAPRTSDLSLPLLLKAGSYERLGGTRGRLLGRLALSILAVYLIPACLSYGAFKHHTGMGALGLARAFFTAPQPDQELRILRYLFAASTGCVAYLCSVLFDTSLLPTLWHPFSRRLRGRAAFLSHVRQNLIFTLGHGLVASALIFVGLFFSHEVWSATVFEAFIMPVLFAFVLMPIPQALFPNGAELFRQKTNPLTQLLAGLVGGAFALLTTYWVAYWPTKSLHDVWPLTYRLGLLGATGVIVYAAYSVYTHAYYSSKDFTRRTAT